MFKLDSPQLPCRADRQHLCEHCLSELVRARSDWITAIKDRCYEAIEIILIVGKVIFGAAFALLAALSYLCPSIMRSSSSIEDEEARTWRENRDREYDREKEEQLQFEHERDHLWKSSQFNDLAHKINSMVDGYASHAEHLENQRLRDEIERNRGADDVDSMIDLADSLASRHQEQAEALRRARERALDQYKRAAAHESYLIRLLKEDPENPELRRDRDDAGKLADRLHRRYQNLC